MPLQSGTSQAVVSQNISELHKGKTYARSARKFGRKLADRQAVAIAMREKRESKRR